MAKETRQPELPGTLAAILAPGEAVLKEAPVVLYVGLGAGARGHIKGHLYLTGKRLVFIRVLLNDQLEELESQEIVAEIGLAAIRTVRPAEYRKNSAIEVVLEGPDSPDIHFVFAEAAAKKQIPLSLNPFRLYREPERDAWLQQVVRSIKASLDRRENTGQPAASRLPDGSEGPLFLGETVFRSHLAYARGAFLSGREELAGASGSAKSGEYPAPLHYILVTDRRVILWKNSGVQERLRSFEYPDIASISEARTADAGEIVLTVKGRNHKSGPLQKHEVPYLAALIRRQMDRCRQETLPEAGAGPAVPEGDRPVPESAEPASPPAPDPDVRIWCIYHR